MPGEYRGRRNLLKTKFFPLFFIIVILVYLSMQVYSVQLRLSIVENFDLSSHHWIINSKGLLSQITLRSKNIGTRTLLIDQVLVNQTIIDKTNWAAESKYLLPGLFGWMYIAPQLITFQRGHTYNFCICMKTGTMFSFSIKASPEHINEEKIELQGAFFHPSGGILEYGNEVDVGVWNKGAVPVIFVRGWCNGEEYDLEKVWIYSGIESYVHFNMRWDAGRNFTFTLQAASGNNFTRTYTTR